MRLFRMAIAAGVTTLALTVLRIVADGLFLEPVYARLLEAGLLLKPGALGPLPLPLLADAAAALLVVGFVERVDRAWLAVLLGAGVSFGLSHLGQAELSRLPSVVPSVWAGTALISGFVAASLAEWMRPDPALTPEGF